MSAFGVPSEAFERTAGSFVWVVQGFSSAFEGFWEAFRELQKVCVKPRGLMQTCWWVFGVPSEALERTAGSFVRVGQGFSWAFGGFWEACKELKVTKVHGRKFATWFSSCQDKPENPNPLGNLKFGPKMHPFHAPLGPVLGAILVSKASIPSGV